MWFRPDFSDGAAYTSKFMAYRDAVQSITELISTQIQFNVESYDGESEYSHDSTYLFVAKETGKYHVGTTIGLASLLDGINVTIEVIKNGTDVVLVGIGKVGQVGAMTLQADGDMQLTANDTLQVNIDHNDAAARNTLTDAGCIFFAHRIG